MQFFKTTITSCILAILIGKLHPSPMFMTITVNKKINKTFKNLR